MGELKKSKKTPAKEKKSVKNTEKVDKSGGKSVSETNSIDKSKDKISDKSVEAPKSASQRSISHFSSVSTKEYRSGWANIFSKKKPGKTKSI